MNSEVMVFVIHDAALKSASCKDIAAALQAEHPCWLVEGDDLATFAAGIYGGAPVMVSLNTHPDVQEESQEMADTLSAKAVSALSVVQARRGNARFEIGWDLTRGPDPVPETAEVVLEAARIMVRLTGGVALINGSRLLDFDAEPFAQLFPG